MGNLINKRVAQLQQQGLRFDRPSTNNKKAKTQRVGISKIEQQKKKLQAQSLRKTKVTTKTTSPKRLTDKTIRVFENKLIRVKTPNKPNSRHNYQ